MQRNITDFFKAWITTNNIKFFSIAFCTLVTVERRFKAWIVLWVTTFYTQHCAEARFVLKQWLGSTMLHAFRSSSSSLATSSSLVTAPSAPITIGTTDTFFQFHIFCIPLLSPGSSRSSLVLFLQFGYQKDMPHRWFGTLCSPFPVRLNLHGRLPYSSRKSIVYRLPCHYHFKHLIL